MSIIKKFVKGGASLFAANVAARASGVIVLALLSRVLSAADLGIYSLIFWVVLSATAIAKLGCDIAIHRNGSQLCKSDPDAAGQLLGIGGFLLTASFLIAGAIVYVFRDSLAAFWLGENESSNWLQYAAVMIAFEGIGIVFTTYLLALHDFKGRSIAIASGSFARLLLVPVLAWLYGVSGALSGLAAASLVQAMVSAFYFRGAAARYRISLRLTHFWQETKAILAFGLPYYVGDASVGLFYLPVMGELRQVAGLESLGYLRIAQSVSQLIGFLPGAVAPVVMSLLSEAHSSDAKGFEQLRSVHLRSNWILALFMVVFVSAAAPSIVGLGFGPQYMGAVPLLMALSWATLVTVVARNLNVYSISAGNTKLVSVGALVEKGTFISAALWSIQWLQTMGFVVSRLLAVTLQFGVMLFGLWRSFNAELKRNIYVLSAVTLAAAAVSFTFSGWQLPIVANAAGGVSLAVAITGGTLVLIFSRQEAKSIYGLVQKQRRRLTSKSL